MMTKEVLLPRDPEKALVEVKEMLYARVETLFSTDWQTEKVTEIEFLRNLLDIMERS